VGTVFGGHHLAFGSTYKDGVMTGATPLFRGVEPFTTFRENGRENAPMPQEQAAFAAMIGGLNDAERAKARLPQTYTDLSQDKQGLVMRAIETYVRDVDPPNADTILPKYRAELVDTHVAYSGTPTVDAENDYVRIDGPSLWIEFSMQPGRVVPGIHPHSVWRDRAADYGGHR
jgi:hypothetical protein